MPILVRNIRLALDEPEPRLLQLAAKLLHVPDSAIRTHAIVRRSLDARKKDDIHFIYQLELDLDESHRAQRDRLKHLPAGSGTWLEPLPDEIPDSGPLEMPQRPTVIGFGPGGMFAALRLAQLGCRPIVFERGRDVERRHRDVLQRFYREGEFDPSSNLLFGEGGAGTYSDGKLYTRISDPLCRYVLEVLYQHGADPDILIDARPHIGSDRLPGICKRIRKRIESLGGEVRFECHMDDIRVIAGRLEAVHVTGRGVETDGAWLPAGPTILAVGHSARDTIRMLASRGVQIEPKPFQIGVRIQHPQIMVDGWQYGTAAGHPRLGPAEYRLVAKGAARKHRDMFSFCMCPGGMIVPAIESPELIATNGASRSRRASPFANSGLVITVDVSTLRLKAGENPGLAALGYLEQWERQVFEATGRSYRVPVQRACDFLQGKASDGQLDISYPLGGQWADIASLLPNPVETALRRALPMLEEKLSGFAGSDALIAAPESRAGGPIRIVRDSITRQAVQTSNLYPVGEGAGYAGGIISSAVDGIKTADTVICQYVPSY